MENNLSNFNVLPYSNKQLLILVILRVVIGWHIFYEGLSKLLNPDLPEQADKLMIRWLAKEPKYRPTLDELKMYLYYWSEGLNTFPKLSRTKTSKWSFWKNK